MKTTSQGSSCPEPPPRVRLRNTTSSCMNHVHVPGRGASLAAPAVTAWRSCMGAVGCSPGQVLRRRPRGLGREGRWRRPPQDSDKGRSGQTRQRVKTLPSSRPAQAGVQAGTEDQEERPCVLPRAGTSRGRETAGGRVGVDEGPTPEASGPPISGSKGPVASCSPESFPWC